MKLYRFLNFMFFHLIPSRRPDPLTVMFVDAFNCAFWGDMKRIVEYCYVNSKKEVLDCNHFQTWVVWFVIWFVYNASDGREGVEIGVSACRHQLCSYLFECSNLCVVLCLCWLWVVWWLSLSQHDIESSFETPNCI